jgi:hypothetical protein
MEPGIPRVGIAERTDVLPGGHERFLYRVLGAVRIAKDECGHGIQTIDGRIHQAGERIVIAFDRSRTSSRVIRATASARRTWPRSYPIASTKSPEGSIGDEERATTKAAHQQQRREPHPYHPEPGTLECASR